MKFYYSNCHTQLSCIQVMYIRELESAQWCICWFDEDAVGQIEKMGLI